MKKIYLLMAVALMTMTARAQLIVDSIGNVGIKSPTNINYTTSIQSTSSATGSLHIFRNPTGNYDPDWPWSVGIYTRVNHNFDITSYGIRAQANPDSSTGIGVGRCFAVYGAAHGATDGYNYGLYGVIGSQNGAGVYGSTVYDMGQALDKRYAGYFRGPVKVQGDVTVTGNISGVVLGAPSQPMGTSTANATRDIASEQISEQLAALDVSTFCHALPVKRSTSAVDTAEVEYPLSAMEQQVLSKQHYGLDAEQLEEVFPDLVYENEDGTKSINYVEMVPILVKAIQELSNKVTELENAGLNKTRAFDNPDGDIATPTPTGNILYQNTPNPFTERTEIRFSLVDDARDAYIYIFDMTGKMLRQIPIDASMQRVTINGFEFSAGIYLYSLAVNGQEIDTKRMILSK